MSNELSERVCRKMGIERAVLVSTWFESLSQAKDFTPVYPDLLTDEWAGKLLAMLAAKGIALTLRYDPTAKSWNCGSNIGPLLWRAGATQAQAVCRAIDSMEEA